MLVYIIEKNPVNFKDLSDTTKKKMEYTHLRVYINLVRMMEIQIDNQDKIVLAFSYPIAEVCL